MPQIQKNTYHTRIRVRTELGFEQTLPTGPEYFELFGSGTQLLILGLGPDPKALADLTETCKSPIYFMECPELLKEVAVPENWERVISLPLWLRTHGSNARIALYRPGIRFFPSFYGPLTAMIQGRYLLSGPAPKSKTILLPCDAQSLLIPELSQAFESEGFTVIKLDKKLGRAHLLKVLNDETPSLFLSVNFQGLDPFGENFHLLRHTGVPVAVWCVDNPWHLVSALRAPFWKECHLFITDPSFIPDLKGHGVRKVLHLPLGSCPKIFANPNKFPARNLQPIVFIGRTAFPEKNHFFAGMHVTSEFNTTISALFNQGVRPDFHYWKKSLFQKTKPDLWPGKNVRKAGFLAEESSTAWRKLCVREALNIGISVFGDYGWADVVPACNLYQPVDYYIDTPRIYCTARYNLTTTSMLLPHSLNQRHFDVWLAGGFLLSDNTPGLELFPRELVEEIRFTKAQDLPLLVEHIEKDPCLRTDLITAWKKEIIHAHTYTCRIQTICEYCRL